MSASESAQVVCCRWRRGVCPNGLNCPYAHSTERYDGGTMSVEELPCERGEYCTYYHGMSAFDEKRLQSLSVRHDYFPSGVHDYDMRLLIPEVQDVLRRCGWPVWWNSARAASLELREKQHDLSRVVFLGDSETGKTWLLSRLLGASQRLNEGQLRVLRSNDAQAGLTRAISVRVATLGAQDANAAVPTSAHRVAFMDTPGSNQRLTEHCDVLRRLLSQRVEATDASEGARSPGVELMLRELARQDSLIREAALRFGQLFIVVLGQISISDQRKLLELTEYLRHANLEGEVVFVHNLQHVRYGAPETGNSEFLNAVKKITRTFRMREARLAEAECPYFAEYTDEFGRLAEVNHSRTDLRGKTSRHLFLPRLDPDDFAGAAYANAVLHRLRQLIGALTPSRIELLPRLAEAFSDVIGQYFQPRADGALMEVLPSVKRDVVRAVRIENAAHRASLREIRTMAEIASELRNDADSKPELQGKTTQDIEGTLLAQAAGITARRYAALEDHDRGFDDPPALQSMPLPVHSGFESDEVPFKWNVEIRHLRDGTGAAVFTVLVVNIVVPGITESSLQHINAHVGWYRGVDFALRSGAQIETFRVALDVEVDPAPTALSDIPIVSGGGDVGGGGKKATTIRIAQEGDAAAPVHVRVHTNIRIDGVIDDWQPRFVYRSGILSVILRTALADGESWSELFAS